jgi:stage II sporulation protein P
MVSLYMRRKGRKMKMIKKVSVLIVVFALVLSVSPCVLADDWYQTAGGYYAVNTMDGHPLFSYAGQIAVDDEYISGDNKLYRVVSVDDSKFTAVALYVEDVVLWEGYSPSMLTTVSAQQGQKKVGIYCSHTDESFNKGDGTADKPEHGGIVDVANSLTDQLKKKGIDAVVDDTPHDPHDAGAYRRSRSSAMNLLESVRPDLLLDIHRDGVPDPNQYNKTIDNQAASKCRFVVGRSNQNKQANLDTAKKMKQVADSTYPGLVKDIFIGHGSYNQDLTPNSMLIEIGTNTVDKARVMKATTYIADVIAKYLGVTGGSQGQQTSKPQGNTQTQGQARGQSTQPQVQQESQKQPTANRTAASSIAWIIGVVGGVCLLFLLVVSVSGHRRERVGNFFKEVTGMGKRGDKDK